MMHKITSEADVHTLAEEARRYKAAGYVSPTDQSELCRSWPDIEKGLNLLKSIFPSAGLIIDGVEAVGNEICTRGTTQYA
ncbi:MAG TPA: hypothetical protein VMF67_02735 [Rhizomicrobium sp.]|nr:hypothetical protein [Rhizomicrobium sp.]